MIEYVLPAFEDEDKETGGGRWRRSMRETVYNRILSRVIRSPISHHLPYSFFSPSPPSKPSIPHSSSLLRKMCRDIFFSPPSLHGGNNSVRIQSAIFSNTALIKGSKDMSDYFTTISVYSRAKPVSRFSISYSLCEIPSR